MNDRELLDPRYDRDSGRWRPYKYGVRIDVPVAEGGSEEGSIQLMNQPCMLYRISHGIIGNTNDYLGTGLANDGQYFIEWKEELSEYQNEPVLAREAYGMPDYPLLLPSPIPFAGNKTLRFRVTNAYTRVLTPEATTFEVGIICHVRADWGPSRRS